MSEEQPKIGRPKLDPADKKVNFNVKLHPAHIKKLDIIIARKSALSGKKYSGAKFIEDTLDETPLPRKPTAAQIAQYNALHPNAPYSPPED